MNYNRVISKFLIGFLVYLSLQPSAFAEETESKNMTEKSENLGVYLYGKVVDSEGLVLEGVNISSGSSKAVTDKSGEFLIKVDPKGSLSLKKAEFMDKTINISSLKGRISLEKIPDYLEIYPNFSAAVNYRNLGFSEKLGEIQSEGRFNDSFSLEGSARFLDSILLDDFLLVDARYERLSGSLLRDKTNENISFGSNLISLKLAYGINIIEDQLSASAGIRGYWNNIGVINPETNTDLELIRKRDYLDSDNSRLALGGEVELKGRPIKYTPFVMGAYFAYYPFVNNSQTNTGLPPGMSGFDYGITARYDIFKIFAQLKFSGKYLFEDQFNSHLAGLSLGLGYAF